MRHSQVQMRAQKKSCLSVTGFFGFLPSLTWLHRNFGSLIKSGQVGLTLTPEDSSGPREPDGIRKGYQATENLIRARKTRSKLQGFFNFQSSVCISSQYCGFESLRGASSWRERSTRRSFCALGCSFRVPTFPVSVKISSLSEASWCGVA